MDTKINLESLLTPARTPLTATPANDNGSFARTFLRQLKGTPDTSDADSTEETPQLPGLDSLIDGLLAKLADTSFAGQSMKFGRSATAQIATDAPPGNASTPDTSVVNPLLLALLNGVPPAQLTPVVQNSAASASGGRFAPPLGIGVTGDSAGTARAVQQALAGLAQQTGTNDMTKNLKLVVSQKGLPVAATPDATPKPITPAMDPAPKPITPADVQSGAFIPPAGPDGVMTPSTPKPQGGKTVAEGQIGAVSPLSGKTTGLQSANQSAGQTAVQPATQNTDPKNHAETSSQSNSGQNSSDTESKKKSPGAEQFSATPVQPSDSQHIQTGNITILSQASAPGSPQNQHSGAAPSSAATTPNAIAAGDTTAPRVVHEARLMQAAGQAEMQVSMRSVSAGTVSVKAILEGSHLSATVSAPSVETRDWLVNNLHELHAGLSRDDLNLRSFQVGDSSLQSGWNGPDTRQRESQEQYRSSAYSGAETSDRPLAETDPANVDLNETASRALSLHA